MRRQTILGIALLFSAFVLLASLWAQTQTAPARPADVPKDWIEYHASTAFSFWGPSDLKEVKLHGIDSYVGSWTSPDMKISFDYGMYSGNYDGDKYKRQEITVDGRKATLATWDGGVGIYVGEIRQYTKLEMSIACAANMSDKAVLLLKSIRFGGGPVTQPMTAPATR